MAQIDARPSRTVENDAALSTMRRVEIVMFLAGGLVCYIGARFTQLTPEAETAQVLIGACFVAAGLGLWVVRKPARRLLDAGVVWSIGLLGWMMAVADPIGMRSSFYLWPVVLSAYFSSRRTVAAVYAWAATTLGVGLLLNPTHDMKFDTFTGTLSSVGLMGALVAVMTNKEAGLRTELALAASTDPLTGLLNRRSFNPRLGVLVDVAVAEGQALSVVMFDLDHFKRLNDAYGHPVGDRALEAVAAVLEAQSRGTDLVCRFGGEEFAVALPHADLADARSYTERVAAALLDLDVAEGLMLSISAGISTLTAEGEPAETLLTRADAALYAAKDGGRNRQAAWGDPIVVGPPFGASTPGRSQVEPIARCSDGRGRARPRLPGRGPSERPAGPSSR